MFGLFVVLSLLRMIRKCFSTPCKFLKAFLQIGQAKTRSLSSSISFSMLFIMTVASGASVIYGLDIERWELFAVGICYIICLVLGYDCIAGGYAITGDIGFGISVFEFSFSGVGFFFVKMPKDFDLIGLMFSIESIIACDCVCGWDKI